ncbi:MAG: HEPN domain-containing protein [Deltaproteobacteria bacterium]|nr:HEPN domain-containing protein [Deltaproteobacteria bacterium]
MSETDGFLARSARYIRSAKLLMGDKDYESAVSRAYYAMFFAVSGLLLTKGLSASTHKGVFSAFGEHFVKPGLFKKEFSKALMRAFEKRQVGDYEYTYTITHDEASAVIEDAERFLDAIAQYLKCPSASPDNQ